MRTLLALFVLGCGSSQKPVATVAHQRAGQRLVPMDYDLRYDRDAPLFYDTLLRMDCAFKVLRDVDGAYCLPLFAQTAIQYRDGDCSFGQLACPAPPDVRFGWDLKNRFFAVGDVCESGVPVVSFKSGSEVPLSTFVRGTWGSVNVGGREVGQLIAADGSEMLALEPIPDATLYVGDERLRTVTRRYGETHVQERGRFYDATLEAECIPARMEGTSVCDPATGDELTHVAYADSGCSQLLVEPTAARFVHGLPLNQGFANDTGQPACAAKPRLYEVTGDGMGAWKGQSIFIGKPGDCEEITYNDQNWVTAREVHAAELATLPTWSSPGQSLGASYSP